MKTAAKIVFSIVLVAFFLIVAEEAVSAAMAVEKWECRRAYCSRYDLNGKKAYGGVFYGVQVRVTWRSKSWLRTDLNSKQTKAYYLKSNFVYVGKE